MDNSFHGGMSVSSGASEYASAQALAQQPVINLLEHKSSLNINMASIHNLQYRKPVQYHDQEKFAAMMGRMKKNKPLFNNQRHVRERLTDFLIPQSKLLKEQATGG